MANAVRARVELKKKYNDPDKNFKEMLHEFKRRVSTAGIMHDFKEHQYYQTKSERNRKKRRDAVKHLQMETLKNKILAGEKYEASPGLVKKVMADINKDKKDKRKDKRKGRGDRYGS